MSVLALLLNFETKAVLLDVATRVPWKAFSVGKSCDCVPPATTILPVDASIASAAIPSEALPPKYVENANPVPDGFIFNRNPSPAPSFVALICVLDGEVCGTRGPAKI